MLLVIAMNANPRNNEVVCMVQHSSPYAWMYWIPLIVHELFLVTLTAARAFSEEFSDHLSSPDLHQRTSLKSSRSQIPHFSPRFHAKAKSFLQPTNIARLLIRDAFMWFFMCVVGS
jgi:hypothetical protein